MPFSYQFVYIFETAAFFQKPEKLRLKKLCNKILIPMLETSTPFLAVRALRLRLITGDEKPAENFISLYRYLFYAD
jgi:hypothetical protein